MHAAIIAIGVDGNPDSLAETPATDFRTDDSGTPSGRVWIDYDGSTINVFINKTGDSKPGSPTMTAPFNLSDLFSETNVVLGFTAGTGGQDDNHDFIDWFFTE